MFPVRVNSYQFPTNKNAHKRITAINRKDIGIAPMAVYYKNMADILGCKSFVELDPPRSLGSGVEGIGESLENVAKSPLARDRRARNVVQRCFIRPLPLE